ncbi:MAG: TonB family protein [Myxococcales bacterium]|jgi:TonB family protein
MPVLRFKVFKGSELIDTRELSRNLIKIGSLSRAHLCINDQKASRLHAAVSVESGKMSLIDMGSAAGTLLNGVRVDRAELHFGDEIQIGDLRIVVEDGTVPDEPSPAEGDLGESGGAASAGNAASPQEPSAAQPPAPEPAPWLAVDARPGEGREAVPPPARDRGLKLAEKAFGTYVTASPRARRAEPGAGPLGLQIRYYWGDTLLEVTQHARPESVYVGTTRRCELRVPADRLGADEWQLLSISDTGRFRLRLAEGMRGEIDRAGARQPLEPDGVDLLETDFAWVELAGLRAEISFEPVQPALVSRFAETLDLRFVNMTLLIGFLVGLFAVAASTHSVADLVADDLSETKLEVMRVMLREAEAPKKNPLLQKLAEQQQPGEAGEKHRGKEGKMGKPDAAPNKENRSVPKAIDINAKELVKRSGLLNVLDSNAGGGGGLATIFGGGGLGGDVKGAIGNLLGPKTGDAHGFGGLGVKGTGTGGGGMGNTVGIGGIGTLGRGGGLANYGVGAAKLDPKKSSEPYVSDGGDPRVTGYDKELIRKVIRRNIAQIRYCYEKELQHQPDLAGRIVVLFVIDANGNVPSARITEGTTLRHQALGNCICTRVQSWTFPAPKGGGQAMVTYPFIFKQSGE